MSFIDIMIVMLVLLGIIIGWIKGFVKQISSICGIALGLVACNLFGGWATDILKLILPESANWPAAGVTVSATAHIVLFVLVFLGVLLIGTLIKSLVKSMQLGVVDKAGGALFCSFKYLLCFSIVLNLWYLISPHSDTFATRHAMNNKPFEVVLDMAPFTLGSDKLPSREIGSADGSALARHSKNNTTDNQRK